MCIKRIIKKALVLLLVTGFAGYLTFNKIEKTKQAKLYDKRIERVD